MKITLETVREVLRNAIGFESFTASFISSVIEDPGHPTAGISKEGRLCYNPEFVARYVNSTEDLFSLILHELLHPMFGHFIYGSGEIENIAADAIINAAISTLYNEQSRGGNLFKRTHRPEGLPGLMRPESDMDNSRYERVYESLYSRCCRARDAITTGELIQTLKILTETQHFNGILLIGTHRGAGSGPNGLEGLPEEILVRIAEEIKQSVRRNASKQAGYSESLLELLMEALNTHLSIRRVLLRKFATKRKVDRFKELFQSQRIAVSPVPIFPSKRDLVFIASGMFPFQYHNKLHQLRKRNSGLAIYLDVSGSVDEYLPKILDVLKGLRREITTAFQFSNKVVETSFESLLKGHIQTTYGTDFDCIARSILERSFDRAVIITDGYASLSPELEGQLAKQGLKTLTILFDDAQSCEAFESFGEVVCLNDICE